MKVLIDCDPGIDDAIALGIALVNKNIELIGITCVNGNVDVEKTTNNTLKILEAYDRKDVPVFKGASNPILRQPDLCASNFHGEDGLGDILKHDPDQTPLQDEHAVDAISRLAKEHAGELTVVAVGPLTNLALALRLRPELATDVKELIIMGGNYQGHGNISIAAEFNFFVDPIAAHIVLEEFECPKYLITWELSRQTFLSTDDILKYCSADTKRSKFKKMILAARNMIDEHTCGFCDAVAVGVALNRDMITKYHEVYATVELEGAHTKGMVVIDWNPQYRIIGGKKNPNIMIVDQINEEMYRKVFLESTTI